MTDKHTKPTPGPWKWTWTEHNYNHLASEVGSRTNVLYGYVCGNGKPDIYVSIADMHLIAVAPDLLELAEEVAAHFAGTDAPLGIKARALLAKAKGEV